MKTQEYLEKKYSLIDREVESKERYQSMRKNIVAVYDIKMEQLKKSKMEELGQLEADYKKEQSDLSRERRALRMEYEKSLEEDKGSQE